MWDRINLRRISRHVLDFYRWHCMPPTLRDYRGIRRTRLPPVRGIILKHEHQYILTDYLPIRPVNKLPFTPVAGRSHRLYASNQDTECYTNRRGDQSNNIRLLYKRRPLYETQSKQTGCHAEEHCTIEHTESNTLEKNLTNCSA